jgi:hypothetical protein
MMQSDWPNVNAAGISSGARSREPLPDAGIGSEWSMKVHLQNPALAANNDSTSLLVNFKRSPCPDQCIAACAKKLSAWAGDPKSRNEKTAIPPGLRTRLASTKYS